MHRKAATRFTIMHLLECTISLRLLNFNQKSVSGEGRRLAPLLEMTGGEIPLLPREPRSSSGHQSHSGPERTVRPTDRTGHTGVTLQVIHSTTA
jgi:hypothetical protein